MIRDLARRRARERRGLALAEGVRLVEEALAAGIALRGAAVSPALEATTRGRSLKSELSRRGVRLEQVSEAELDGLADTEHPQGVVAVIEPRRWRLEDIAVGPGSTLLVLDAVQDPGNVGTMLRTALGLGAAGVVALKGTAELTSPKVVRGSMGALFNLPAVSAETEEFLGWARERRVRIWVTAAEGEPLGTAHGAHHERPPTALVLGNEGAGVGASLEAAAERRVAIPLAPGAESLNVAVAAGIFLYEVMRAD
ncbi:MAG: RNA methyltransferase [Gemmatimonadales bacterium]|nr:RNA methyltransferase [Gemmatimonadales bacterium]